MKSRHCANVAPHTAHFTLDVKSRSSLTQTRPEESGYQPAFTTKPNSFIEELQRVLMEMDPPNRLQRAVRQCAYQNPALKFRTVIALKPMQSYQKQQKLIRADSKGSDSLTLMTFVDWHLT